MAREDEITTRFTVDISDLKRGISDAQKQIQLANAEFKKATAGSEDWANSIDGVKAKLDQLKSVLDAQKKKVDAYTQEIERNEKAYQENGKRAAELREKLQDLANNGVKKTDDQYKEYERRLNSVEAEQEKNRNAADKLKVTLLNQEAAVKTTEAEISKYDSRLDELERGANSAEGEVEELTDSVEDSGEAARDSESGFTVMKGALASLVADGIRMAIDALKEFAQETINVGMDFEKSMSKVKAISGANAEEFDALKQKASELGATTTFTATEVADGFSYMAMAGWKTEDMLNGIEGILNLAAASGSDLATTSDIVTDALTAFGMQASEAGHFADVLAQAASNSNTDVNMMGETFKYLAPLAGTLGYNVEDVAQAIGILANSGIKASQAGTTLRTILSNLAAPSKEAQGALVSLGLVASEVENVVDDEKVQKAMEKLADKTATAEKAQISYDQAVAKYGAESSQAQKALISLNQAMDKAVAAQNALNDAKYGELTVVSETNLAMTDEEGNVLSLAEVIERLRDSFADLSPIEQAAYSDAIAGNRAMAALLTTVNATDEDVEKLNGAIASASDTFVKTVDGSVIPMNQALREGAEWTQEYSGAAEAMAAVMRDNLAGDVTLMQSNLNSLQNDLYDKLAPTFREAVGVVNVFIDALRGVADLDDVFDALDGLYESIKDQIIPVTEQGAEIVMQIATRIVDSLPLLLDAGVRIILGLVQGITSEIPNLLRSIARVIPELINMLLSYLPDLLDCAVDLLMALVEAIPIVLDELARALPDLIDHITEWLVEGLPRLIDGAVALFMAIVEAIPVLIPIIVKALPQIISSIVNTLVNMQQALLNGAVTLLMAIIQAIPILVKSLIPEIPKIVETIINVLIENFPVLLEGAVTLFFAFIEAIPIVALELLKAGKQLVEASLKSVQDLPDRLKRLFLNAWDKIKEVFAKVPEFFKEKFDAAIEKLQTVKESFAKVFSDLWDRIKQTFSGVGDWFKQTFSGVISVLKGPINFMIRGINTIIDALNMLSFDVPDWIPGIGGKHFGFQISHINELARGGVLERGQRGFLEGTGAEAVVPLENNKKWIAAVARDMAKEFGFGGNGIGGNSYSRNAGYNYTQIINAPKMPSRIELYRQTKNLLALTAEGAN